MLLYFFYNQTIKKMKHLFIFTTAITLLLMSACTKDDVGIKLQNHDQNRMMDSMHAMMSRMMALPKTNDPEIDFSKMMILHHQGAINTSNVELQDGKNDSLKRIAQKIIAEQMAEIAQFNTILAGVIVDNSDPAFTMEQMENMMKGAKVADVQVITGDMDNDFATLMIIHHQGAIDNSSAYLHHGDNVQLKVMATKIIATQLKEIEELSNWLLANKKR